MFFLDLLLTAIISLLIFTIRILFKMNKSIGRLEGKEFANEKKIDRIDYRVSKLEKTKNNSI